MADGLSVSSPNAERVGDALRRAAAKMPAEDKQAERQVAGQARRVTARAPRTPQQRRMAGGIGVEARQQVSVTIRNTAGAPGAVGAFAGGYRRTGWYAARKYAQSRGRQRPQWEGRRGLPGGPVGDALEKAADDFADTHQDAHVRAIDRALRSS